MIFRQLFDQETSTYTYIIGSVETHEAVVIDPVREQAPRDAQLLHELELTPKYIMETHIHADHITGSALLKQQFPTACSVVSMHGGVDCADLLVQEGDKLQVGEITIQILETPGHTDSCLSYLIGSMVFTGDALLIRGCGRTDFQQGSPEKLYERIMQKLFTLPDETLVYPAHDYNGRSCSSIGEEKRYNLRLAHKTSAEFVAIMQQLHLSPPQKIAESVPANLKCGQL